MVVLKIYLKESKYDERIRVTACECAMSFATGLSPVGESGILRAASNVLDVGVDLGIIVFERANASEKFQVLEIPNGHAEDGWTPLTTVKSWWCS